MRRVLLLGAVGLTFVSVGCGSNDPPAADELPLARGTQLAAHGVRTTDDNTHVTYLLISGKEGQTPKAVRREEVAHLRALGWHLRQQYGDRSWAVDSPDRTIWSNVGFRSYRTCGFEGEVSLQNVPYICAAIGRFQDG